MPRLPSVVPPGCLLLGLELERGNADRGQWQRSVRPRRLGFPVVELFADSLELPAHIDLGRVEVDARGARRGPSGASRRARKRDPNRARTGGGWRPAGRARSAPGNPRSPGWQPRLSTLRHTAGCRPGATPGTARHRLATVTPAGRATRAETAILPALQS